MKNISFLKILILGLSIILAGYFIGEMNWKSQKNNRKVQVKGLSERIVDANLAVWPMKITFISNNLKELNAKIAHQKKIVVEFFRTKGFNKDEITSGVGNISDAKANLYNNNRNLDFRYLANLEITLRTTDISKIKIAQKEVVALLSKGIVINSKNTWRPIQYFFTNLNSIKPAMIEEATKKAKEVAEKFAKDSNSKVGKIKTANQGLFSINDRDENTPFVKKVRVVTSITYFLED